MLIFFIEYIEQSTTTRLRRRSKADVSFMPSSYHLHMPCAKHGYASCHIGCIGGDARERDSTTPDHGIQSYGGEFDILHTSQNLIYILYFRSIAAEEIIASLRQQMCLILLYYLECPLESPIFLNPILIAITINQSRDSIQFQQLSTFVANLWFQDRLTSALAGVDTALPSSS